jgi:hypothetical protein
LQSLWRTGGFTRGTPLGGVPARLCGRFQSARPYAIRTGAILQHSAAPLPRLFEDENDEEDELEPKRSQCQVFLQAGPGGPVLAAFPIRHFLISRLIESVAHRGDEFLIVEWLHEIGDRADGHGGGARCYVFARGNHNDAGLR